MNAPNSTAVDRPNREQAEEAAHQCMTTCGIRDAGIRRVTSRLLGVFRDDAASRREVFGMMRRSS